jgi:hypothetical protein
VSSLFRAYAGPTHTLSLPTKATPFRAPSGRIAAFREAIKLNPSFAAAHVLLGQMCLYAGRPEEAIEQAEKGIRLSPTDPRLFNRAIALSAIEHALFDDRDLMPDPVPLADQHGAGAKRSPAPNRGRSLPVQQAASSPSLGFPAWPRPSPRSRGARSSTRVVGESRRPCSRALAGNSSSWPHPAHSTLT